MATARDRLAPADRSRLALLEDAFVATGLLVVGSIAAYVVVATLIVSIGGWL